jgi:serine/threonine-protein kinase
LQETILNGRYRLDKTIGEGGMAMVYHGWDLLLNREVAVKILRDQYAADDGFLKRFEREAQIAAGMSHPNIVNVYDVGQDQGLRYIVMEYIRGPNLKELIIRHGPFSVDGAVFIISQVASALDYAHQRGLVHRDIKPQNILVDRDGNAKVVDFGIAKGPFDANLTEVGSGMGTVHYVSPEQARGENVGSASDIYSTGVVLFEMLTKQLPFNADTPVGVAMQHVNNSPPTPSSLNPAIPPAIDALVLRAMAKDPTERFPSGAAFEAALRHWQEPGFLEQQTRVAPLATGVTGGGSSPVREQRTVVQPGRRLPPPPPGRRPARGRGPEPTPARNEIGCLTWIIGAALLALIVGIVVVALEWGPSLFDDADSNDDGSGVVATTTPAGSSPTSIVEQPTAVPTETVTAEPTSSATAEPTITAEPTLEPTPEPTATPEGQPLPDLRNATIEQAQVAVGNYWTLTVLEEPSNEVPVGLIIWQDPGPEVMLDEGEEVTVWVSSGPETVVIPELSGVTRDEAIAEIEALGLGWVEISEASASVPAGLVINTDPTGEVSVGTEVTIYVSIGDVVTVPEFYGFDVIGVVETLEENGFLVRNVSPQTCDFIQLNDEGFDCDEFPNGGVYAVLTNDGPIFAGDSAARGETVDVIYYQAVAASP